MIQPQTQLVLAPGIGTRVITFMNDSSIPSYIVVENRDASLSAMIEYDDSDDGTTWSTIVGTSKSIAPKQSDGQIVLSNRRRISLFAQGNVDLQVTVVRQYNGENQII